MSAMVHVLDGLGSKVKSNSKSMQLIIKLAEYTIRVINLGRCSLFE